MPMMPPAPTSADPSNPPSVTVESPSPPVRWNPPVALGKKVTTALTLFMVRRPSPESIQESLETPTRTLGLTVPLSRMELASAPARVPPHSPQPSDPYPRPTPIQNPSLRDCWVGL